MIEKVNPSHPDKIADRISGAIVDLGYKKNNNPKIAVEVLIGHGICHVIIETSEVFSYMEINKIVKRIAGDVKLDLKVVKQDEYLAKNQVGGIRCGDNGIFKGVPLSDNEKEISKLVRWEYNKCPYDGKYILTDDTFIVCQSNITNEELRKDFSLVRESVIINPLGEWTGGIDVDTGATNRKLGSDMARSVTGGGLHGKDLSKADVSVNIYAFMKAQETNREIEIRVAIGDTLVDGIPYEEIVSIAREYIKNIGGFEKFAEWGLF